MAIKDVIIIAQKKRLYFLFESVKYESPSISIVTDFVGLGPTWRMALDVNECPLYDLALDSNVFLFYFHDVGILAVFDQTGLIS